MGRLVVPHCWKTGIGIAASAHLGFAAACCPFIEFLPTHLSESVLRDELVADELQMVDGEIPVAAETGSGHRVEPGRAAAIPSGLDQRDIRRKQGRPNRLTLFR